VWRFPSGFYMKIAFHINNLHKIVISLYIHFFSLTLSSQREEKREREKIILFKKRKFLCIYLHRTSERGNIVHHIVNFNASKTETIKTQIASEFQVVIAMLQKNKFFFVFCFDAFYIQQIQNEFFT
jgi:hypothetical protein